MLYNFFDNMTMFHTMSQKVYYRNESISLEEWCEDKQFIVLDCSYSKLELPMCLDFLVNLSCKQCGLTSLPDNLHNLRFLTCSFNNIKSIDFQCHNLEYLDCEYNKVEYLSPNLANLNTLLCGNNRISSLPDGLIKLKKLFINNNLLETIPEYLNLQILECAGNKLIELPSLKKLTYLGCADNLLETVPNGLDELQTLICMKNPLLARIESYPKLSLFQCDPAIELLDNLLPNRDLKIYFGDSMYEHN